MKYLLLFVGLALAFFGFTYWMKYFKIRKTSVKAVGRVIDSRKVEASAKMPSGWAAVAEYEVGGKKVRGVSVIPMAQKYANGYRIELLWNKEKPLTFIPTAFTRAMQIYGLLLPIGMAMAVWGITMFF